MKTNLINIIAIFAITTTLSVNAFAVNYDEYKSANTDYLTFKIDDKGFDAQDKPLSYLFNAYFSEQLGKDSFKEYNNANELYQDRGIKYSVDAWQINEGSEIIASFKNAMFMQDLIIQNTDTQSIERYTFASNIFDNELNVDTIEIGASGEYTFGLETFNLFNGNSSMGILDGVNSENNPGNVIQMVAFDVTDLMRKINGYEDIETAFMFGWEDLNYNSADFDYQDLVYIAINVKPTNYTPPTIVETGLGLESNNATPEPATIAIFGLGGALAVPFLRKRFQKK